MKVLVSAFAEDAPAAGRLAAALDSQLALIALHHFPDGECLPSVTGEAGTVLLYRSLDQPDPKLMPLLLACDAWRRAGARRLVLVAPYLCYMRQDQRFAPGQPVSRDVLASLLGPRFERIVTVAPHLHRTHNIGALFKTEVSVLSAARPLAEAIGRDGAPAFLIGPDIESDPFTAALAAELGAPYMTFRKTRLGDRRVTFTRAEAAALRDRRVVLVDDICSSGATLAAAAEVAIQAGAASVEAAVVHALFDDAVAAKLKAAGISRIVSTDSCSHPTNKAPLAAVLSGGLACI